MERPVRSEATVSDRPKPVDPCAEIATVKQTLRESRL